MTDEIKINYINRIIDDILNSEQFKKAEQNAHRRNYKTVFRKGELKHDRQQDYFVSYEVFDSTGCMVETFDDGFLCAYEPLMIKNRHGDWKITNGFTEFLSDINNIANFLESFSFVAEVKDNLDLSIDSLKTYSVSVCATWFEDNILTIIVDVEHDGDLVFPAIGDCFEYSGKVFQIIKIA